MDIIDELKTSLNIPENAARGLAGQVFGLIEDTVRDRVSFSVASQIHSAIPELLKWQASSPTIVPGTLHVSDLAEERTENDEAELIRLLERFHVDVEKSSVVGALALQFLATRVDPKVLTIVAFTMPSLTHNK
jgi:hypothetical protein